MRIISGFSDFLKKNQRLLIFNIVIVGIVFGSRIFSNNVQVDTDLMTIYPYFKYNWLEIGRWGLILFQKIFHMRWFNPYIEAALAYVTIVAFLMIFSYLFDHLKSKDRKLNYYIFSALFITHPIFALQWFFKLQCFEVALSILFVPIALLFIFEWINSKKVTYLFISLILSIISFSCYQTNVILYISVALVAFYLRYEKENDFKINLVVCIKLILSFLSAFIINTIFSKLFFVQSEYLTDSIYWKSYSFKECINNIISYLKEVLFGSVVMTSVFSILLVVILVLFIKTKKNSIYDFFRWVVIVVFLISPFLLSIYMGGSPFYRSQYVLPFVIGAGLMLSISMLKSAFSNKISIILKNVLLTFCSFTILLQTQTTLRIWYTEDVRYSQDYSMLQNIITDMRLNDINYMEKPVIFIGKWDAPLNPSCLSVVEMVGISHFSMFSTTEPLYYYSSLGIYRLAVINGYNLKEPTIDDVEEAKKEGQDMANWPNKGYIKEMDSIIIVRLSDYNMNK